MRKLISLLLTLTLLAPAMAAQQKVRDAAQRGAGADETAQRKLEEAQRKTQAIDILKGVVESAADIQETRTRVAILTGALDLLWKHDEAYTRAQFIKSAASLSDTFASDATQRQERSEIRSSLGVLITALARHDPQAAARLLDKFQKMLEDVLKGNLSLSERLSLAQASLDSDAAQSAALAAKVLEVGVPGSFPSYLYELEQRDAAAAASLFRVALARLSGGRVYTPVHVNVLSAYVFRESQMSVPVPQGGRDGAPLEFGMFASPLSPPSKEFNRALVAAYLAASSAYLNIEAIGLEQRGDPDAIHVGLSFFLVKKLSGYAEKLGIDGGQNWPLLNAKYAMLAERAKLGDRALSELATVAQRIVAENTVFRFDSGESAFARAEKASDPAERAELLATGIRQQIDEGKYAEAVPKIADVRDEKYREQLNTYLTFRMAEASFKKLDWYNFNSQVNRVSDAELRTYLVLSAAMAASDAGKKKMSSDFLLTAMAAFPKIEDLNARAAAVVTAASILYATADASWSAQVLTEGVTAINRATRYDGGVYNVTLEVANSMMLFPLPKSDLSHCFEQAAKRDWPGALAAAQSIESKALRSQAYIAACRTVL
ncbi:MAG TPA: hypothetical protein VLB46_18215 [Pyrinomonadaceae bacterium]|nr:hypothetical protein [Pyrinomonadaceae bacterium]